MNPVDKGQLMRELARSQEPGPVNPAALSTRHKAMLKLVDDDIPQAGNRPANDDDRPVKVRRAQMHLLSGLAKKACNGEPPSKATRDDVAGLIENLPGRAATAQRWKNYRLHAGLQWQVDGIVKPQYADYHDGFEALWMMTHAAALVGEDPDAEQLVRALTSACERYTLNPSAKQHIGAVIDCWCQATGIDVPNPTGMWEIRIGAEALGWKNPRRHRPSD